MLNHKKITCSRLPPDRQASATEGSALVRKISQRCKEDGEITNNFFDLQIKNNLCLRPVIDVMQNTLRSV